MSEEGNSQALPPELRPLRIGIRKTIRNRDKFSRNAASKRRRFQQYRQKYYLSARNKQNDRSYNNLSNINNLSTGFIGAGAGLNPALTMNLVELIHMRNFFYRDTKAQGCMNVLMGIIYKNDIDLVTDDEMDEEQPTESEYSLMKTLYDENFVYPFMKYIVQQKILFGFCIFKIGIDPDTLRFYMKPFHWTTQGALEVLYDENSGEADLQFIPAGIGTLRSLSNLTLNVWSEEFGFVNRIQGDSEEELYVYVFDGYIPEYGQPVPKTSVYGLYHEMLMVEQAQRLELINATVATERRIIVQSQKQDRMDSTQTAAISFSNANMTTSDINRSEDFLNDLSFYERLWYQEGQRLHSTHMVNFWDSRMAQSYVGNVNVGQYTKMFPIPTGFQHAHSDPATSQSTFARKNLLEQKEILSRRFQEIILGVGLAQNVRQSADPRAATHLNIDAENYRNTIQEHKDSVNDVFQFCHHVVINKLLKRFRSMQAYCDEIKEHSVKLIPTRKESVNNRCETIMKNTENLIIGRLKITGEIQLPQDPPNIADIIQVFSAKLLDEENAVTMVSRSLDLEDDPEEILKRLKQEREEHEKEDLQHQKDMIKIQGLPGGGAGKIGGPSKGGAGKGPPPASSGTPKTPVSRDTKEK